MSESNSDNGEPAAKKIKLEPNQEPIQEETLEMKDGKPWNGNGEWTYANGSSYVGNFKEGLRHGKGKQTDTNGNSYEGDFKEGLLHGKGKYTNTDGSSYDGEWKDNNIEGFGEYKFPNDRVYVG